MALVKGYMVQTFNAEENTSFEVLYAVKADGSVWATDEIDTTKKQNVHFNLADRRWHRISGVPEIASFIGNYEFTN